MLSEIGAVGAAIEAAVETGDRELQAQLAVALAAVGEEFSEFGFVLDDLRVQLGRIREGVDRHSAELQVSVGLQYRQATDIRLLLEQVAAIERRTRPRAARRDDRGPAWSEGSPYRGLAPFGEADAQVFFGRELLTAQLVAVLSRRPPCSGPLIVTGASGAGKSSLLRAGLIPAIGRGELSGAAADWPRHVLGQPTRSPLTRLATLLAGLAGVDAPTALRGLTADPGSAAALARQAVEVDARRRGVPAEAAAAARLVLVVDQFEEIFTSDETERERGERSGFITALHAAASVPNGAGGSPAALVVIAVRGDFIDRCAGYHELTAALQQDPFVVGPMSDTELRRVITGPADAAGLDVEPGLVDAILGELNASAGRPAGRHDAGALPLLSQTMLTVWEHRDGDRLTSRGYARTGGVTRAVATSADAVYDALTEPQRIAARQMFQMLTSVSADGALARRTVGRADLHANRTRDERADLDHVLESYARARLVVVDGDRAQIAHDVLLHAWPRLSAWLEPDLTGHVLYGQLRDSAEDWDRRGRPASYLYRGEQLAAVRNARARWRADPGRYPSLTPAEDDFLAAGIRAEARSGRRRRAVLAVLAALVAAAVTAAVIAVDAQRAADRERDLALSRLVAARGDQVRGSDPVVSGLLAAAAWRYAPTGEARHGMVAALATPARAVLNGRVGAVLAIAFRPDGASLAIGGENGTAQLWDTSTLRPTGHPLTGHAATVWPVTFSPDGTVLATGDGDETHPGLIRLWSTATGRQIGAALAGHTGEILAMAFSRDGGTLVTVDSDWSIRTWDTARRRPIGEPIRAGRPRAAADELTPMALSPDRKILAIGYANAETVQLWDMVHRRPMGAPFKVKGFSGGVAAMAFSPDGEFLATGGSDDGRSGGTVRLWRTSTHRQVGAPIKIGGSQAHVEAVAFSPDGKSLATGGQDGTARLWDTTTRKPISIPYRGHTSGIQMVAFSSDGTALATGSLDGTTRLWDTTIWRQTGEPIPIPMARSGPGAVGLSRDGGTLALSGVRIESNSGSVLNGTARLLDTATGRPIGAPLAINDVGMVDAVALSPNGRILVTAGASGVVGSGTVVEPKVRAFDMAARRRLPLGDTGDAGGSGGIAFSADGKVLAVQGTHLQLWDTTTLKLISKHEVTDAAKGGASSMAFSPDGKVIFVAEADETGTGTIRLWDIASWRQIGDPLKSGTAPTAIAVSPDGATLAIGDKDGGLRLWDVATRRQLAGPLPSDGTGALRALAFGPDGGTITAAGYEGAVRSWRIPLPSDPLRSVCALAGRSLTEQEWRQYLPEGEPYQRTCG
ncbi:WD40 repeat domain-containing protein [Actinomadura rubrisoli]|uniref:Novel STAND NTPase 1 domain-containing protein n=1 Tax=Actinomadura rubrisoli TaxID=2530368 RepID=A0A4R5CHZ2_9ACTN|nr:WD40 repeat domain-containing protein [Actinomadura rubrisoli]TDD98160.1 hypothetical protein E1298_00400 [Actinomadura rubrisoli]